MSPHLLRFSFGKSVPLVLQSEGAECGLACLAMVAGYHGYNIDLASLRHRFATSQQGITLDRLMQVASELDLSPRPLRVELPALHKLRLPAVLHWDMAHFVVLCSVSSKAVVLHDPARGRRTLTINEVSAHFTGVALELEPTPAFSVRDERRTVGFRQLLGTMPGLLKTAGQIVFLAGALELIAVAAPLFMQLIVDNALASSNSSLISTLGTGFLVLALVQVGIGALRGWLLIFLGTHLNLKLISNLFQHLVRLPLSFFENRHLGDVLSRFESMNVIQRTITTSFLEAMIDGVMVVLTVTMMVIYSAKLSAVVLGAALLYGSLRVVLYRSFRDATEEQITRGARQQSYFLETLRGIQTVKIFNRQLLRRVMWQNLLIDTTNAGIRAQQINLAFKAANGLIFGLENIAVIWLGALAVQANSISLGMLFAFLSYKQQFITRALSLVEKSIELRMLGLHRERVADIALTAPESLGGDGFDAGYLASAEPPSIELRNISYTYSVGGPWVLRNVNMKIGSGECVAIVGPSGCGKTTLVKIVLGLLRPTEGQILVGGIPLEKVGEVAYRDLVGAVMQDDQLFAGTVAENISFFDASASMRDIRASAETAAVHDDIMAMPMNYRTLVGDMGAVLSGGQKQRVLLARALYKRPRILLLDEATSHLDVEKERVVNEAIKQESITRIIIAHRPDTIRAASRVIDISKCGSSIQPAEALLLDC